MKTVFDDEKKIYEEWAEYWDSVWVQKDTSKKLYSINKKEQFYFKLVGIINSYIKDYIKKNKNYKIIEIGCGGSSTFPILINSSNNLKIYGIDKSPNACKFVSEMDIYKDKSIDIICGDALELPLKHNYFNIVYSIGLIEHFENQKDIIKSHVNLLKKGGLLVILIPNLMGFQASLLRSKLFKSVKSTNNKFWINGMKIITPNELRKKLIDIGCVNIKIKPSGGLHPLLMLESYYSENYSKAERFSDTIYKIFLSPLFILINIPFMFKLNLINLSPFIVATAIKNK